MSIDVRYITTKDRTGFYVRNSSIEPTTITIYDKKEDVPSSIRDYCDDSKPPKFVGPDFALILGCQDILYPNFSKCQNPYYSGYRCIAESCEYAVNGDWTKCPYFHRHDKGEK